MTPPLAKHDARSATSPPTTHLITSDKVVHAASKGHPRVGDLRPSDLGALHPHQDQSRAEERQDDGDDDEGATHVDVPYPRPRHGLEWNPVPLSHWGHLHHHFGCKLRKETLHNASMCLGR